MAAIDIIKRRLKEDRVPDVPDEISEKKKRPREAAFMDMNLCFPCGKCPEFCPVQCIEYLALDTLAGRGVQPVQDRFQECIGCYICVEICSLLTDYDAIRMYDVDIVRTLTEERGDSVDAEVLAWAEAVREGIGSHARDLDLALPWARLVFGDALSHRVMPPEPALDWTAIKRFFAPLPPWPTRRITARLPYANSRLSAHAWRPRAPHGATPLHAHRCPRREPRAFCRSLWSAGPPSFDPRPAHENDVQRHGVWLSLRPDAKALLDRVPRC